MNEAYKAAQLHGKALSAWHALYLATRGAAHALYLDDMIGSLEPGHEADVVVLDLHSTSLIDYRMRHCRDIEEALFVPLFWLLHVLTLRRAGSCWCEPVSRQVALLELS